VVAEISFFGLLWYALAGLIIGALARLFLPGRQQLGVLMTMVIGAVSAVIGGFLWELIFSNRGIAWIGSVVVAMVVLWAYDRVMTKRSTPPPPPGSTPS
jgi:uncharacterized membrane protein YeaQ/YmgE (transglycosylase-associated protein family)